MRTFQISNITELLPFLVYQAATETIGGVNNSIPLHPDDNPPDFNEHKRKIVRKPAAGNPNEDAGNKPPDPDHQIDEYA